MNSDTRSDDHVLQFYIAIYCTVVVIIIIYMYYRNENTRTDSMFNNNRIFLCGAYLEV